ncbi:MAG: hypothetical protein IT429_22860 [Gemmataceae bacterium]|nr:hypothetical protein [Gemmataceae bacterium]
MEPIPRLGQRRSLQRQRLLPRANGNLLQSACRVDHLFDRLYQPRGVEGKRPRLLIPT